MIRHWFNEHSAFQTIQFGSNCILQSAICKKSSFSTSDSHCHNQDHNGTCAGLGCSQVTCDSLCCLCYSRTTVQLLSSFDVEINCCDNVSWASWRSLNEQGKLSVQVLKKFPEFRQCKLKTMPFLSSLKRFWFSFCQQMIRWFDSRGGILGYPQLQHVCSWFWMWVKYFNINHNLNLSASAAGLVVGQIPGMGIWELVQQRFEISKLQQGRVSVRVLHCM